MKTNGGRFNPDKTLADEGELLAHVVVRHGSPIHAPNAVFDVIGSPTEIAAHIADRLRFRSISGSVSEGAVTIDYTEAPR